MHPYGVPAPLSFEDAQVNAGKGGTVSTSIVAVATGTALTMELTNNTSEDMVMTKRSFSHSMNAVLEYIRYADNASVIFPAAGTPVTVPAKNRKSGKTAPAVTLRYVSTNSTPAVSQQSSAGFIPPQGSEKKISEIVTIPPGGRLIYSIGGAGGGTLTGTDPTRMTATFLFYLTAAS